MTDCLVLYVYVGETVDLGENEAVALAEPVVRPLREKMVYMSVGDGHHTQTDGERLCLFHNVKLFLPVLLSLTNTKIKKK